MEDPDKINLLQKLIQIKNTYPHWVFLYDLEMLPIEALKTLYGQYLLKIMDENELQNDKMLYWNFLLVMVCLYYQVLNIESIINISHYYILTDFYTIVIIKNQF